MLKAIGYSLVAVADTLWSKDVNMAGTCIDSADFGEPIKLINSIAEFEKSHSLRMQRYRSRYLALDIDRRSCSGSV